MDRYPAQQYLLCLLKNCYNFKKLTQIHTQIIVTNFPQNFVLLSVLLLYFKFDYLPHAHHVFKQIENPSVPIWNQIIRAHAKSETPKRSIELYNQMGAMKAEPSGITYSHIINACSKSAFWREGEQIHGRVLSNGFCSNVFVQTNLLNFYSLVERNGGIIGARRVFDEMCERSMVTWNSLLSGYIRCRDLSGAKILFDEMPERNTISWTTMIAGFSKNGGCRHALSLFSEMQRSGVEFDQVTMVAALTACADLGDLRMGKWIHSYINQKLENQPLLLSLLNSLIHMYASCGAIDEAYDIFLRMPKPSTISFTSMIFGFARNGLMEKALNVFEWMENSKQNDVKPDDITFSVVLYACTNARLVSKGQHLFHDMKRKYGIERRIEHYGCMVDLLSREGLLDEAFEVVMSMPMKPTDAIWGALLSCCKIYKNLNIGSHVAQKLIGLDPHRATAYILLLSNLYKYAKRWEGFPWENAPLVRQRMVEINLGKPVGRSQVQINGVLHVFSDDDSNSRCANEIYHMLAILTKETTFVLGCLEAVHVPPLRDRGGRSGGAVCFSDY